MKTVFHKRGRYDWHDACRLCVSHPLHASFFVQKLWGYFVPVAPDRATRARARARSTGSGLQVAAGLAGDPQAPGALRRPAHGEAADRAHRRAAAPHRRGHHDRPTGRGSAALSGQQLFYPPNVAGWDDTRWLDTATFRGRWIAVERILQRPQARSGEGARKPVDAADRASSGRSRSGTSRRSAPRRTPRCCTSRSAALADARQGQVEAAAVPGARRERAAPADRRLPGRADLMSRVVCDECTRADALRAVAGTRPAGDRARHADAGRDRPDAPQLRRALGRARAHGLRRRAAADASRRASPRPRPGRRTRSSSRCSCRAAPTRSRCSIRTAIRSTASCGRSSRLTAARPFAEDARLFWHPALGADRAAARRGQGHACCRRSATTIPTSRTSRRATSGRSARPSRRCSPAGSAATSTSSASPTTRCRGCR